MHRQRLEDGDRFAEGDLGLGGVAMRLVQVGHVAIHQRLAVKCRRVVPVSLDEGLEDVQRFLP